MQRDASAIDRACVYSLDWVSFVVVVAHVASILAFLSHSYTSSPCYTDTHVDTNTSKGPSGSSMGSVFRIDLWNNRKIWIEKSVTYLVTDAPFLDAIGRQSRAIAQ